VEENVLTEVEATLKTALEARVRLGGEPVPVRIVTPDPDFVELVLPCITVQFTDLRRDPSRVDNDRRVEKDLDAMEATIRPPTEPYNLHYSVGVHAERLRDERLLLEQVLLLLDEVPVLAANVREFYVARDLSFRDLSRGREIAQSVGIVVRARLEQSGVVTVPLAAEHAVSAKEV
jgi:hypothetical protein